MSLEKLLEENKIERIEKKEFSLELAERDLKAAKDNISSENFDWALSIAYIVVYDAADYVSRAVAEEAIKQAEIFVQEIRTYVLKIGTKGEK